MKCRCAFAVAEFIPLCPLDTLRFLLSWGGESPAAVRLCDKAVYSSQTSYGFGWGAPGIHLGRYDRLAGQVSNAFRLPWRSGSSWAVAWLRRRPVVSNAFRLPWREDKKGCCSVLPMVSCMSLKRLSAFVAGGIFASSGRGSDFLYQSLKRLSAFVAGGIARKFFSCITIQLLKSQTPFGFGGGLDGRLHGCGHCHAPDVSNAFRLWGRVGFWSRLPGMRTRTVCLKRLSALGAGWILLHMAIFVKGIHSLKRLSALGAGWIAYL